MGRYFLGVEVPADPCGARLMEMETRLNPLVDVKKWYGVEQFHITTHFLGELEPAAVEELTALAGQALRGVQPFTLRLGRVGWFPQAKVVWCGVEGDAEALQGMYQVLTAGLAGAGSFDATRFAHDRFRPHITLGRLKGADAGFSPGRVEVGDLAEGTEWEVRAVHLFESVSRSGGGPDYPIRQTYAF